MKPLNILLLIHYARSRLCLLCVCSASSFLSLGSDQGANFSSHMFSQVLKQLHVKHNQASAYHAQSQGALERFNQTLKSLLRAYCAEMQRDWEEGLTWLLVAAREVTQESTRFSPNDLVFRHIVRGQLTLFHDQ